MINSIKYLLFALAISLLGTGCYFNDDDGGGVFSCERGSGEIITEIVDVPTFTGIQLNNSVDVYLRQGTSQKVEIEGQENLIELLELDVQNKTWDIEFDRCVRNLDDFKIFITSPLIDFVGVSGSGKVYSENQLEGEDLTLRVSGSGDIDLSMLMQNLDAKISGSGKMKLEGFSEEFYLKISASGDYDAFDLETERGEVIINGSGDVDVFVNERLDVTINGSGDLRYKGFPLLDIEINGSGDIINAN